MIGIAVVIFVVLAVLWRRDNQEKTETINMIADECLWYAQENRRLRAELGLPVE